MYQINVSDILDAVIQTRLLAPNLGGTRKLKPGHMEFPPISAEIKRINTNITNKHQKPELARKLLVLRRGSWHHNRIMASQSDHGITIPPHDVRQQYLQGFNTALTLSGIDPRIERNQISHITIECTSKNQKVPPALRWQQVNESNARLFDADTESRSMVFNSPSLVFQSSIWQYRTSSAPTFNDILKKEKQKSSPKAKTNHQGIFITKLRCTQNASLCHGLERKSACCMSDRT